MRSDPVRNDRGHPRSRRDSSGSPTVAFTLLFVLVLVGPSWSERSPLDAARPQVVRIERRCETARPLRSAVPLQPGTGRLVSATTRRPRPAEPCAAPLAVLRHGLPLPRAPDPA